MIRHALQQLVTLKTIALRTFLCVLFLTVTTVVGQLDPTFGSGGVVTAGNGVTHGVIGNFILPDGKILIVTRRNCCFGPHKQFFFKFNTDGTPDFTYGTNGVREIPTPGDPGQGVIRAAARQQDGKIVLVGSDYSAQGIVARYNEDGTLDSGFADSGIHRPNISPLSRDGVTSVLIQPDGKILVAGFVEVGSTERLYILRYLPNGSLDISFGTSGGFVVHATLAVPPSFIDESYALFALQSTGKILVGAGSPSQTRIWRFTSQGAYDDSFAPITLSSVHPLAGVAASVQPDDKILAAQTVRKTETLERSHLDPVILRYNPDGSPDAGFGTAGQSSFDLTHYQNDLPLEIQALPDGQILVALNTDFVPNRSIYRDWTLTYARLSSSGQVMGKFATVNGYQSSGNIATSLLADGRILSAYIQLDANGTGNILLVRIVGVPLVTYKLRGVPFNFPFGQGGNALPSVFRPGDGTWHIRNANPSTFGHPGDIRVPSDYLANFFPEYALFSPSTGTWYIARDYNVTPSVIAIRWGLEGDIPQPHDYDGDGKSDLAVFRPSEGVWYIRNSFDESYSIHRWGLNGDRPAAGDFDGDGKYDLAVYRPSDGHWYIYRSSDGGYTIAHFGLSEDIPVQEDYDGDGKTDIAVYRPSNGVWYRLNSSDGSYFEYQWGLPGDVPVPGDYDSDLKTNVAVWRPSNGNWYIVNPDYASMHFYTWGISTDVPLAGKF
ncbi:MAG TPA: FG-GAP-like repeat-containing protein [Pyrinomonadaceae bacterium]